MCRLGRGKSNHSICRKNRIGIGQRSLSRIRWPARRQINCQDRSPAPLHPLKSRVGKPLQRRLESRPHHRIQNQIGVQRIRASLQILRLGKDVNMPARQAGNLEPSLGCVARDPRRLAQQQCRHIQPSTSQQASGHHSIAAVIAPAAHHRNTPRLWKPLPGKPGYRRRRRPHQLQRRYPKPLSSRAVASLHLGCGENLHGSYGSVRGRRFGFGIVG